MRYVVLQSANSADGTAGLCTLFENCSNLRHLNIADMHFHDYCESNKVREILNKIIGMTELYFFYENLDVLTNLMLPWL